MGKTSIEWCEDSENPIRVIEEDGGGWWCEPISPGCDNCYASALNQFRGNGRTYGNGDRPRLYLDRDLLARWARQTKPRRHFVASMTDIFGSWIPQNWLFEILDAMAAAHRQTFLMLTKWALRMRLVVSRWLEARGLEELPPNIWPCATVENQIFADKRIPELLKIPARCHGLSIEPLLEALHLWPSWLQLELQAFGGGNARLFPRIDFAMVGGESGQTDAVRPLHPHRVEALRDQCLNFGVRFFFKQWGAWAPLCLASDCRWEELEDFWPETRDLIAVDLDGKIFQRRLKGQWESHGHPPEDAFWFVRVGKKYSGRLLNGAFWNQSLLWDPEKEEVVRID